MSIGLAQDKQSAVTPNSVSGTWVRDQKLGDGSRISLMKIITPTHFAVFQSDAAGVKHELFQAHSGRYTLENEVMIENYTFSSNAQMIGKSAKCRVIIDGDTLRQIWKSDEGKTAEEVWTRESVKTNERVSKP